MNFPDKKIYRRRYKYCWLIEIICFLSFLPLIFKIIPKIRIFHDIQRRSEARIKKKKKLIPRGTFGPKRRRDRERVPRHFLGSPRGKWLRVTDRPRESSFPRCEMERRPGPKNDQRQIFRALCSLPAIQRDPKTRGRGAAWIEVKGGGRTSHLLGPFPFAITISAPLSVPMGSIRFLSAPNLSICIRYIDRIRARGSSRKWRAPISFPTLQGFLPHRDISEETRTKSGEISCAYKNIRVYSG